MGDKLDAMDDPPKTRMIGGHRYAFLGSFPRLYAEGLKAQLEAGRIPVHVETPFTDAGVIEIYMGTYMGDVSLWVPADLLEQAHRVLEREATPEEPPHQEEP
ncbi:hypothetical protein Mterra_01496 [Calidithermus terrae]|uniref:DUF2007 domain-containing protein n=1 Tax=Calidithermus terrae TaxID=1408545 RepID=A0A399ENQ2_9DEIN|nr:hypothetical protein Mterra_01496 [Calidithermus terrae]